MGLERAESNMQKFVSLDASEKLEYAGLTPDMSNNLENSKFEVPSA